MTNGSASKDPYQILGIAKTASESDIKSAYRKLAKSLHPDLNPGNKQAEEKFKDVSAAYELLSDKQMRAKYDRGELYEGPFAQTPKGPFGGAGAGGFRGRPGAGGGPFQGFESGGPFGGGPRHFYYETQGPSGEGGYSEGFSFEDLFGEAMKRPGADEHYRMEVDLADVARGAEREITLPNGKHLRVKIPPGVTDGTKLRFAGQGGPGARGAPAGDVYVELAIRPSPVFRRERTNLELDLPITLAEAVGGGEIRVPTLEGQVMLKVPEGVSSGSRLRIRGKGLPERGNPSAKGDLYVILRIAMPPEIDDELKQAILSWSAKHPYDPRADLARAA